MTERINDAPDGCATGTRSDGPTSSCAASAVIAKRGEMIERNEHVIVGPIRGQPLPWQVIVVRPPRKSTRRKDYDDSDISRAEAVAQFKEEQMAIEFCRVWNTNH